jgi:hypothetical protein
MASISSTYLKNAFYAQWLCCKPPQNTHIRLCMLRFFVGLRLALERELLFLRQLLIIVSIYFTYYKIKNGTIYKKEVNLFPDSFLTKIAVLGKR